MKHKFDIKNMALGGLLGAVIMFSAGAATTERTAWDYKIVTGRLRAYGPTAAPTLGRQIDQAAADGWEVVSTGSDDGFPFVILRKPK
jgi:hypothetical protein